MLEVQPQRTPLGSSPCAPCLRESQVIVENLFVVWKQDTKSGFYSLAARRTALKTASGVIARMHFSSYGHGSRIQHGAHSTGV